MLKGHNILLLSCAAVRIPGGLSLLIWHGWLGLLTKVRQAELHYCWYEYLPIIVSSKGGRRPNQNRISHMLGPG
jgi:hypothetical protein